MILGTPGYLAPERIDGRIATSAADLYSLGVVLFECLTGVRSFPARRWRSHW
jgi:eukaryotic-like serine/threonine-protein kinase